MIRRAAAMFPWGRVLLAVQSAVMLKRHVDMLEPEERREAVRIVKEARGRVWRLSSRDREELLRIARKLDPAGLGKEISGVSRGPRAGRRPS